MKLTSAQVSHYGPQCNCNYILGKHKQLVSSFSAAIPQLMFVNDLDVQNSIVFREIRIDFFFRLSMRMNLSSLIAHPNMTEGIS